MVYGFPPTVSVERLLKLLGIAWTHKGTGRLLWVLLARGGKRQRSAKPQAAWRSLPQSLEELADGGLVVGAEGLTGDGGCGGLRGVLDGRAELGRVGGGEPAAEVAGAGGGER